MLDPKTQSRIDAMRLYDTGMSNASETLEALTATGLPLAVASQMLEEHDEWRAGQCHRAAFAWVRPIEGLTVAYCFPDGCIRFGEAVPVSAYPLLRGKRQGITSMLIQVAGTRDGGVTFFVPDLADATTDAARQAALMAFNNKVKARLARHSGRA